MNIFSVFDSKLNAYMTPFFAKNVGVALRSFSDLVSDSRSVVAQHPEDFFLFRIGSFSEDSGEIVPETPLQVAKALDIFPPEDNHG